MGRLRRAVLAPVVAGVTVVPRRAADPPASDPTQFRADFPVGVHESLSLSTRWLQGEVPYFFGLDVRAAGNEGSGGRMLALTG